MEECYIKVSKEVLDKVKKITLTNYELIMEELVPISSIEPLIEDLLAEIYHLQEELEDAKEYRSYGE